jgi:hypothetical protein
MISTSQAMPCSAQKSSISCVSGMPPMLELANERRLVNEDRCSGSGSAGAPTLTIVPLNARSPR